MEQQTQHQNDALQSKIERAKKSTKAVKDIEKLEKEIARLEANIAKKKDKILEIAKQL